MSTTNELTWGRLHIDRETLDPTTRRSTRHDPPLIRVIGYTRTEQARYMTLTRAELVELIGKAVEALTAIDKSDREEIAHLARRVENDLTGSDAQAIAVAIRRLRT